MAFKGYLLAATGVLLLSPDSLVLRLLDADPFTLSFWRGAGTTVVIYGWCRLVERRSLWHFVRTSPPLMWLFAGLQPFSTVAFVLAIYQTEVANVLIVIALLPLLTAVIAWLTLKESLRPLTWLAIGIAAGGVSLVYMSGFAAGSGFGMVMVSLSVLGYAICFTILRKYKDRSFVPALAIGGLIQMALLGPFYQGAGIAGGMDWFLIAIMALVISCIPFILLTLATRYISAAETSLMLLIETALGPLWVWLVLSEVPSQQALIGGAIVMLAVGLNAGSALRDRSLRLR